jgi:hypothetical protein
MMMGPSISSAACERHLQKIAVESGSGTCVDSSITNLMHITSVQTKGAQRKRESESTRVGPKRQCLCYLILSLIVSMIDDSWISSHVGRK